MKNKESSNISSANFDSSMENYKEELKKYFIYKNFLFEVMKEANENFRESIEKGSIIKKLVHGIKQDKEKIR